MREFLLAYLPLVIFIGVALVIGLALLMVAVPGGLQAAGPGEAVGL